MPEIPYEQLLQAQLGTLVAVFGIVLLIVIGLTVVLVGVPLMRLLSRMADSNQATQQDAKQALAETRLAQTALTNAGGKLAQALSENTAEIKAQTNVLTSLKLDLHNQIETSARTMTNRLDAHDTQAREGITRIETAIAALRDEFSTGHKAQRVEVITKLDQVLAEIRALHPPPEPPHVVTPARASDTQAALTVGVAEARDVVRLPAAAREDGTAGGAA